jgi:stress response protein YsnF
MAERRRTEKIVDEKIVPVVEESAIVSTERVVTETVRLHKQVHEEEEVLEIPLQDEEIAVERVSIDRWVDEPVAVRHEGDTTVYPVLKEVLVYETRLKLVEEVRVTRRRATRQTQERVRLRREDIVVERDAASGDRSREA